jgi:thiosulfate reductase cytochrome b subunit
MRRGYGRACATGAEATDAEILVFMDGDGSDRPEFVADLLGPLIDDAADFTIGSRARGDREKGSMGIHQLVAGLVIGWIVGLFSTFRYTDMCAFRAIRAPALRSLGMREMTYGWNLEMQMRVAQAGLRIREIPVAYRRRIAGRSKVAGTVGGSVKAAFRIVATLIRVSREKAGTTAGHAHGPTRLVTIHPLAVRLCHWGNALAILILIGSGWKIYNNAPLFGFKFPVWITLGGSPSPAWHRHGDSGYAGALLWHFAAMWLLLGASTVYILYGILSGHFRKTLLPLTPSGVARDVSDALTGRLDHRLGVRNQVQRVLYIAAILGIVLMLFSGLAIWKPVQFQDLTALFGGYDVARYVHFFGMSGLVLFLLFHIGLTALVPKVLPPMIIGRGHVEIDVLEAEGRR